MIFKNSFNPGDFSAKSDLDGLSSELELRIDATSQELLKLKKTLHDDLERRLLPLSQEVQQLSENLDTLIGQVESKVDDTELQGLARLEEVNIKIQEVKDYIDSIQADLQPARENLSVIEDEKRLKINELEAQMPELQQRLEELMLR